MSTHNICFGSKYFARRPPLALPPGPWGSKGLISTFSGQGHVAYQIKGNHKCSNMVAIILLADPPPHPDPGDKVKIQLLQNMVILFVCFVA